MPKSRIPRTLSLNEIATLMQGQEALPPAAIFTIATMSEVQLSQWKRSWDALSADRRAALMEQFRDTAEEEIEKDFTPIFLHGLHDADPRVRLAATEGLVGEVDAQFVEPLIARLEQDTSEAVRAAAAQALAPLMSQGEIELLPKAKRDKVYRALRAALQREAQTSPVYRRALEAIAYVNTEEVDWLIRSAYHADDDLLRLSAVVAMGRSANSAYQPFVRAELHSISPLVRGAAAIACGELEDEEATPDLIKLLDDPSETVRFAALEGLALVGTQAARDALERAAQSEDEAFADAAKEAIEVWEFWHGQMDFPLALFDEADLKPNRIVRPPDED
ncbi:MAG: HEAT repeat domain-containing protein [Anaerolineae bacterium]|nr:HEAT repeat domain-containing protein [Thermoflexales bacterium]MDW8395007.1 HEAT repeat domain-containing protein [Anaerolineae bacterium]